MSTWKVALISIAVTLAVALPAGILIDKYLLTDTVVVVPQKPVSTIIKQPVTNDDYRKAFESVIKMKSTWNKPVLTITAGDGWKQTVQGFEIKIPEYKHEIGLFAIAIFDYQRLNFAAGGGLSYYYFPIQRVGVGFSIGATNRQVIAELGVKVKI